MFTTPDPRTRRARAAPPAAAGIVSRSGVGKAAARAAAAGFLTRQVLGRPPVSLKLALSLDR